MTIDFLILLHARENKSCEKSKGVNIGRHYRGKASSQAA